MAFRSYVIERNGLREAKGALEDALQIHFEERDSSWYASLYYRWVSDEGHELQLCVNEDFEGEPIKDDVEKEAVLLRVSCPAENDELLRQLDQLSFLRQID